MAVVSTLVCGHTVRPWGVEYRVDFTDDTGAITNDVLTFAAEPTPDELDAAVAARRDALTARLNAEARDGD